MRMNSFLSRLLVDVCLIRFGIQKNTVSRIGLFIVMLSSVIFITLQYYLWKSVYKYNSVQYMSFGETFSYIVFAQCIYCIYPSSTSNIIGELMKNGNISLYMVKPISIFRRFIFEQIGTSIYKFIFLALPTLAIAWLFFGVSVGRPDMLIILAILIFSYLFYFTFEMIIGCLSFITKSIWGIQSLKFTVLLLLTGRIIPLDFYPTSIQKVITKLPFRFFFASLADSISRNVSFSIYDFLELTATVILSIIIYIVIFSLACRHFTVQGG